MKRQTEKDKERETQTERKRAFQQMKMGKKSNKKPYYKI